MAFIVEDGTGVAGANSLCDVAFADTYHADRANASWASSTQAAKEAALIKATDYIEQRFGGRFKGRREHETQVLSFPRLYLYTRDGVLVKGIPDRLKAAVSEYALKALTVSLFLEPEVDDRGLRVKRHREKVDVLEEEIEYAEAQTAQVIREIPAADRLMADFITSAGTVIRA